MCRCILSATLIAMVLTSASTLAATGNAERGVDVPNAIWRGCGSAITAWKPIRCTCMGNKTLEDVKDGIAQHLQDAQRRQHQQTLIGELRKAASIRMLMQPPIAEVAIEGAPTRGAENAPVTLVEFSDFQCPYCARVQPTLLKVMEAYQDQVKLVYKDFPLPQLHPQAPKAAEAARCAGEQDKYWDYHDALFEDAKDLSPDKLKRYAADLKLDTAAFDACLDSGKYTAGVRNDMAQGAQLGLNSTPSFFINGRFLSGAQPFSTFQALIDEVLASP